MKVSIRSIFYRLILSYSLVGTLPLTIACLLILLWGNTLVVRYMQSVGSSLTESVAEEIDRSVIRFTEIGMALAEDSAVLTALDPELRAPKQDIELELYKSIFASIQEHLSIVEVHLSTVDGMRKFSTTEFPNRYDLANHQIRDTYISHDISPTPRLSLSPGPGTDGNQILYSLSFSLPGGILFIDVRSRALETPLQAQTSSRLFLVHRKLFTSINLLQPQEPTSFSVYPELGIIFTDKYVLQPQHDQLLHRFDLETEDLSVIMITGLATYFETLRQILLLAFALIVVMLLIMALISIKISRSISRPIDEIIEAMTSDPRGPIPLPLTEHDPVSPRDELEQLTFQYNRMVETIFSLIQKVREEEQLLRAEERKALQAQIQPHFLYNTLGSVKSMAKLGDFKAVSTIVTDLGKILRFTLSDTETMTTLEDSTDLIRRYLNIQKIRFQERMHVVMDMDPAAAATRVPKLIIQPLVENSVIHGVEKSARPVTITLSTRYSRDVLEIRVEDDGPGFHDGKVARDGLGIGLKNVKRRLHLTYGNRTSFSLTREKEKTTALIKIRQ